MIVRKILISIRMYCIPMLTSNINQIKTIRILVQVEYEQHFLYIDIVTDKNITSKRNDVNVQTEVKETYSNNGRNIKHLYILQKIIFCIEHAY